MVAAKSSTVSARWSVSYVASLRLAYQSYIGQWRLQWSCSWRLLRSCSMARHRVASA